MMDGYLTQFDIARILRVKQRTANRKIRTEMEHVYSCKTYYISPASFEAWQKSKTRNAPVDPRVARAMYDELKEELKTTQQKSTPIDPRVARAMYEDLNPGVKLPPVGYKSPRQIAEELRIQYGLPPRGSRGARGSAAGATAPRATKGVKVG